MDNIPQPISSCPFAVWMFFGIFKNHFWLFSIIIFLIFCFAVAVVAVVACLLADLTTHGFENQRLCTCVCVCMCLYVCVYVCVYVCIAMTRLPKPKQEIQKPTFFISDTEQEKIVKQMKG